MKIAISSFGKESTELLDTRFGRCEYFQIYDTDSGQYESFENEAKGSAQGAGVAASQGVIDRGIDVLITGKLGPNAYELLSDSGIKLYTSESVAVEESVRLYQDGKLQEIVSSGVGHAGLNPSSGGRNRYRNS